MCNALFHIHQYLNLISNTCMQGWLNTCVFIVHRLMKQLSLELTLSTLVMEKLVIGLTKGQSVHLSVCLPKFACLSICTIYLCIISCLPVCIRF